MTKYNVLAIAQPLVDCIVRITDKQLEYIGITEKGGSQLLKSVEELEHLINRINESFTFCENNSSNSLSTSPSNEQPSSPVLSTDEPLSPIFSNKNGLPYKENLYGKQKDKLSLNVRKPKNAIIKLGGSTSNVLRGMAALGETCAYCGKIGEDVIGNICQNTMSVNQIIPLMSTSKISSTGQVICLITPDGQRTMRAYLGASLELNKDDLLEQDFYGIKLLHIEGYLIYNLPLTLKAMALAKKHNALISFDVGSFELVRQFKDVLLNTILPQYVDIVFVNEEEAMEFAPTPSKCVDLLSKLCTVSVVMLGPKGCMSIKSGSEKYFCPSKPVKPIDTIGAGDSFAAGFLYGYLQGYSIEMCCRIGNEAGKEATQVVGSDIPNCVWERIKKSVNDYTYNQMTRKYFESLKSNGDKPASPYKISKSFNKTPSLSISKSYKSSYTRRGRDENKDDDYFDSRGNIHGDNIQMSFSYSHGSKNPFFHNTKNKSSNKNKVAN